MDYSVGSIGRVVVVRLNEGDELTIPTDNYFVIGDNRPFSSDSRAWGFITKDERII